jgi:hypothetical protein
MRRRSLFRPVALLLLLVVSAAMGELGFVHQDDGCAVERHCLACRWAAGATAVLGTTPRLPVPIAWVEVPERQHAAPAATPLADLTASRGPPLA